MRKVSRRIAFVTQEFESFHSHRSRAGWCNLVCVECLYMIKPMMVGFCSIGDLYYSE